MEFIHLEQNSSRDGEFYWVRETEKDQTHVFMNMTEEIEFKILVLITKYYWYAIWILWSTDD